MIDKRMYIEESSKDKNKMLKIILIDLEKNQIFFNKKVYDLDKVKNYYKDLIKNSIPISDKYYNLFRKIDLSFIYNNLSKHEFLENCEMDEWVI